MKALTSLGIVFFYLHYLFILILATFCNIFKYLWKKMGSHTISEKQHLSPFEVTHCDVFSDLYEFISHEDYKMEIFSFQTSDKARIEMWRVYHKGCTFSKPYPVLLMHGLLDCSGSWFMHLDKSKSLPYLLASEGYEVWVGNNRGNRVSQKEQHPDNAFWDYNMDHLIHFDQPTIIEGVLERSKKEKLIYIGHSQGSTQFLLGLGLHHQLEDKIAGFVGLGTAVSLGGIKDHTILKMMDKLKLLQLCNIIGLRKILILPHYISKAVGVIIYNSHFHYDFMMFFVRLLCGFSLKNKISNKLFGVMITHEPGGASSNNALQWIQCYRNGGEMRMFDYGPKRNVELYGNEVPKVYGLDHLEKVPFQTFLFRGMKDAVMTEQNFAKLGQLFPQDKISTYQIVDYHHLQYLWSETAYLDVYPQLLQIVEKCNA